MAKISARGDKAKHAFKVRRGTHSVTEGAEYRVVLTEQGRVLIRLTKTFGPTYEHKASTAFKIMGRLKKNGVSDPVEAVRDSLVRRGFEITDEEVPSG